MDIPVPVAGITPLTLVDFPGKISAVFYLQGCPLRCAYCHNTEFRHQGVTQRVSHPIIEEFLNSRRDLLDAIVVSGGEPTMHPKLSHFLKYLKRYGFLVGLHTSGTLPEYLEKVLPFCDWIGMDVKTTPERYEELTGFSGSGIAVLKSMRAIVESGKAYEFRTTVHPDLIKEDEIELLARRLKKIGSKSYALQAFQGEGVPNESLVERMPQDFRFSHLLTEKLSNLFPNFVVRY